MTLTLIPVAGVTAPTEIISAAAQTEILAEIDKVLALIPDVDMPGAQDTPPAGTAPHYDKWHPDVASMMRTEFEALKIAIDAAPTA